MNIHDAERNQESWPIRIRTIRTLVFLGALLIALPAICVAAIEGKPCGTEPTNDLISFGDLITCSIGSVGDSDKFRFSGISGQTVVIVASVRSSGGAPCVELRGPDNAVIGKGCGGYPYGQPRVDAKLVRSGVHTIFVSEYQNNATLGYTLALERVAPPSSSASSICPGCSLQNEINPVGDYDEFLFQGKAGDGATLTAPTTSGTGNACVELFGPDGILIGTGCGGYPYGEPKVDVKLKKDGRHSVLISEYQNNATVKYRLTYQCVGVCPPKPSTPDLEGYELLKGAPLAGRQVCVSQSGVAQKCTNTDAAGYWKFPSGTLVKGKSFNVTIFGPVVQ